MKTIKSIKENVNVRTQLEKFPTALEDCSEKEIIEFSASAEISIKIQNVCKRNSNQVSYSNTIISYEITNEEVINLFRELYKLTSNKFVKSVLVSVGQDKKFSEKQISVITDEMIKFENLTINF